MKFTTLARLVPTAGFALSLGLAQAATAQTATGTMAPAAPAAATPAAPMAAPATAAAPAVKTTTSKTATTKITLPANEQFKTQAEATAHCPADTVVWASMTKAGAFHLSTSKLYGKTKHGAYVCEKDATAAGMHQAKN